jgi:NAD(P)-dependent dehydrogenase (short-subunit alcohol dehydrogenase family)
MPDRAAIETGDSSGIGRAVAEARGEARYGQTIEIANARGRRADVG